MYPLDTTPDVVDVSGTEAVFDVLVGVKPRVVQFSCDQAWGWSRATGALTAKVNVPANVGERIRFDKSVRLYVITSGSAGKLARAPLE
jgi:hypothetical protein